MNAAGSSPVTKPSRPRRKILWIVLGGLALLAVGATLALPLLLDPERYRGHIEGAMRSATGWDADLGSIDYSIWHGFVLTVGPARLESPDGASHIAVQRIEIDARLRPLLQGKLEIGAVQLIEPEIELIREEGQQEWSLPLGDGFDSPDSPPAAEPEGDDSGIEVSIETVSVRQGRILIEDRAATPPLVLELDRFETTLRPTAGTLEGGAHLPREGGDLAWSGSLSDGLILELDSIPTEALHRWVAPELLHGGGLLSGTMALSMPLALDGSLTGEGIALLDGQRPLDSFGLDFRLVQAADGYALESLELDAGGLPIRGSGSLFPTTALKFEIPPTGLDNLLRAADSLLPLPVVVEGPGEVEADFLVDLTPDGELSYEGRGSLTAARFVPSEMLPPVEAVRSAFELDRAGVLTVEVLEGRAGGGPIRGTAVVDPVFPPGELTFQGGLQEAVLGQLLTGFVGAPAEPITGATSLDADLALNLGAEVLDARSLSGRMEFDSSQVTLPGWDLEQALQTRLEEAIPGLGQLLGTPSANEAAAVSELFRGVEAKLDFDQWPWGIERLSLKSAGLRAVGQGTFDPISGEVDLAFTASLSKKRSEELVAEHRELRALLNDKGRIALPMTVRGALTSPAIRPEVGDVLVQGLRGEVEREAEDKLKDLVRGLIDKD